MITYQPTAQLPFMIDTPSVTGNQAVPMSGVRKHRQARTDIPPVVKSVRVSCMNKHYSGIGFRNDNGGMEFYSDDCRKHLVGSIEEDIVLLRARLESMEDELASVKAESGYGSLHIDEWNVALRQKSDEAANVQSQLEQLVLQARSCAMDVQENTKFRNQLQLEQRVVTRQQAEIQKKVDCYHECRLRERFLTLCIDEMRHKLSERELSIADSSTFTVYRSGLLTLPFVRGFRSESCCVFSNILDYLSYILLANGREPGFPRGCDAIVLNHPRNILRLLLSCDVYEHVYCFFPNTIYGKTLESTLLERNASRAVSQCYLYAGHATLFDYVNCMTDYSPLSLVR